MTATHWTLAQTLQRRGITTHALIKASGLSKSTVYDIVNGKTQGVTLETVDKLLEGLEQLTGQRMTLNAVLDRTDSDRIVDTALLAQLTDLPAFDLEAVKATIPDWTPTEQEENNKQWLAHEYDRRSRGDTRQQKLDALWEEMDGDEQAQDEKESA